MFIKKSKLYLEGVGDDKWNYIPFGTEPIYSIFTNETEMLSKIRDLKLTKDRWFSLEYK